jgi:hypothetical protein
VTTIVDELKRIADEPVPPDELEKARSFAKGRFVLSLEDPRGTILFGLRAEVLEGRAREPDEVLAGLDAVTVEDVQRVASDILREDRLIMERLRDNAETLRDGVLARGLDAGASTSPVVPLILGDEWRAYQWSRRMLEDGVFVSAVVFPAVGRGMARLRLCATAAHRPEHFDHLFQAIDNCLAEEAAG